jgi:hypothetical protein
VPSVGEQLVQQRLSLSAKKPCLSQDCPSCSKVEWPSGKVLSLKRFWAMTGCRLLELNQLTQSLPMLHEYVPIENASWTPSPA